MLPIKTIALVFLAAVACAQGAGRPPNILIILADDLGFSDLGCYGSEIETPNLDRLASGGLRFTQFYNTARCWPTRAALMTGYYAQQVRRDEVPGVPSGGGNRGIRPPWAPLLPERLSPLGYRSYHSGKWHLEGMPVASGFDRSYYLKDQSRFFSPRQHWRDDKPLPPIERGTGFYGTTAVADHAIECLSDHARDHADRPFFHYLAFAAPHFPLHALPDDIARYHGRYDRGWEVVRDARWEKVRDLVGGKLSAVEGEIGPPYHFPDHLAILGDGEVNRPLPWRDLSEEQQDFQAKKMEIHAAMIDRMDREIGRVLTQIEKMGATDDTIILFLSDNGASAEIMVRGDGHDPDAPPGSAATYLCLGPGWSTTCNTPFRRHKTWVHEGGIATPFIACWPAGIAAHGELRTTPAHAIDIVPTLLRAAGAEPTAPPVPLPGKDLGSSFASDTRIPRDHLWWLHEGNRAIRVDDWKLVAAKDAPWELYDLAADRTEQVDLSGDHPKKAAELAARWEGAWERIIADANRDLPTGR